ncbi:MAG: hypothetical protein KGL26_15035 [Pseudomonadota bacterium]|nr:hypothetical protein [Pseudomonadota bacterium]
MTVSQSDHSAASAAMSEFMTSLNHSFAESLDHSRTLFERGLSVWQEETLALIERRLEHGREAIASWRESEDLNDTIATQRKWIAQMASDYRDGMMRAAERVQSAMIEGVATAKSSARAADGDGRTEAAPKPGALPRDTREHRLHSEERQTPQAA